MTKPTVYQGQRLPFLQLEPGMFERFTHSVFDCALAERHGFKVTSKPPEGADSGYDSRGFRIADNKAVCLQAKRYQHLSIPVVGLELAKIALQSAIENEPVFEHFIVGAGILRQKLVKALNHQDLGEIRERALAEATLSEELKVRRDRVAALGLDPAALVEAHLARIKRPEVWSGEMLDMKLGACFSAVAEIIEEYFTVHTVLREHPRPDFSEQDYIVRMSKPFQPHMRLSLAPTGLPRTLYHNSGSSSEPNPAPQESAFDTLAATGPDDMRIVLAPGGGGKTTCLRGALYQASMRRREAQERPLPIFVPLGGYVGSLDDKANAVLKIQHGSWRSIPGHKLLLLDGLDRVSRGWLPTLTTELEALALRDDVGTVISCRSGGPHYSMELPEGIETYRLRSPNNLEILAFAREQLGENATEFLSQLWGRVRPQGLLEIPFGIAEALSTYQQTGVVPPTDSQLMERLVQCRLTENERRHEALPDPLADIPAETVRELAEAFAFSARALQARLSWTNQELGTGLADAIASLSSIAVGRERVDSAAAKLLLCHYELIHQDNDGSWGFVHDLFADFLAARRLAATWRDHLNLDSEAFDELWIFAAPHVVASERDEFFKAMLHSDILRGCRCTSECGTSESVESLVLSQADSSPLYYECNKLALALSVLDTRNAIARLRALARSGRTEASRWTATKALARLGDHEIVEFAVNDADSHLCSGIQVSGGWNDMVKISSPTTLLKIARKRVTNFAKYRCLTVSLSIIAAYGNVDDIEGVRDAILNSTNLPGLLEGLAALHDLAAESAEAVAREHFAPEANRGVQIAMANFLRHRGYEVSPARLADLLVDEAQDEDANDRHLQRIELAKILRELQLDDDAVASLKSALAGADAELWRFLLQVAETHSLAFLVHRATSLLSSEHRVDDRADALRYLLALDSKEPELRRYLLEVSDLREPDGPEDSVWALGPVFELVKRVEGQAAASALLVQRVEFLVKQAGASTKREDTNRWEHALVGVVELMAVHIDDVPFELCMCVIDASHMYSLTNSADLARAIVERTSPDELDEALESMTDRWNQARLLAVASRSARTPRRRALLLGLLKRNPGASMNGYLDEALDGLWDDEILGDVLDAMLRANRQPEQIPFRIAAQKHLDVIARRMQAHHADVLTSTANRSDCPDEIRVELLNLASAARRRA